MAKKLAITIAGAVSLGSYESGVAFEIISAIAQHNLWADAQDPPTERFEIDVLTGASAGGMTVAILAQRLLFDGNSLNNPYNNPLYNAWVKQIDIDGLLPLRTSKPNPPRPTCPSGYLVPEPAANSLLSSDCVIEISLSSITDRYVNNLPPPAKRHPAINTEDSLFLGLSLSNLSGVDYERPTQSGKQFVYTDHQDQFLCQLDPTTDDSMATWEPIRRAAVSCGAFPFAFRAQDLLRTSADYRGPYLSPTVFATADPRNFTYTDGGVFQNEPLGMAKNFVDKIPGARTNPDKRAYLFIAPHPKKSEELPWTNSPEDDPAQRFGAANATFKAMLSRVLGSIMTQSEFQDWVTAEDVNAKLRLLDRRADELARLYREGALKPEATAPVSFTILQTLFKTSSPGKNGLQSLSEARAQLKDQYIIGYNGLLEALPPAFGSPAIADAWLDAVLVLEYAGGLHFKEEMYIFDFLADSTRLAGAGLKAFQGFFDQKFRDHDYDYGRDQGRSRLQFYQKQPGGFFSTLHWTPDPNNPIHPIDPALNSAPLTSISVSKRQELSRSLSDAADVLLTEAGLGKLTRWALRTCVIKGKIKSLLGL